MKERKIIIVDISKEFKEIILANYNTFKRLGEGPKNETIKTENIDKRSI